MNECQSKAIAEQLLRALSADDVKNVVESEDSIYWFENQSNWKPYGDRDKNWDTVGNQQANAVGALVELITNGIDAILMRRAKEEGIDDMRAASAPQSMFEAVNRFFPKVVEGHIATLSPKQRTELAEQCIIIGVKRAERKNSRYPTYTVIDRGEGQLPDDFPKTFLSLSVRNKEGIQFVQGKYNMGSTGTLRYCTRADIKKGHYKFLVSKRPGEKYWGWTLIRVREARKEEGLPVAEYFFPGGQIPRFRSDMLSALGHPTLGEISDGTVVKLYEFDVGRGAHAVDLGLDNALTVSLIDCALPVRIFDFDAEPYEKRGVLRKEGIAARTFSGMNVTLRREGDEYHEDSSGATISDVTEWQKTILIENNEELGQINIVATGIKDLRASLRDQPARIFYTVNGQTHAFERASFLNSVAVGLGDLRNHLIVNVICDKMDKTALANIFMPDRERKVNNNQSRLLEEIVAKSLKNDNKLRSYAAEIRLRRASEYAEEKEESRELLEDLVKTDPEIQNLFGVGAKFPEITKVRGGQEEWTDGKKFPTRLDPLNLKNENERFVKEVPVKGRRFIHCGTDAENEYFSRPSSPGKVHCSLPIKEMPFNVNLYNGTATFTVKAPTNAKIGDSKIVEFGFVDNGRNLQPLKFAVEIRYVEEEPLATAERGKKTGTADKIKDSLALPRFEWVEEPKWEEHGFTESSGAYIAIGEEKVVYLNHDHRSLKLMREKEKDEAKRTIYEAMFKIGLGIFALSVYHKATAVPDDAEIQEGSQINPDDAVRLATEAIAPHIITVIKRLGGAA